ncbi:putative Ig domain-containing protein [Aquirufa ecclesiirivi]|uniref:putative Ig domain-containing protein n=1 Tax=Aquirufa ecclesiirivi TaxID=2715124 RepID=UPI003BAECE6C
MQKCYSTFKVTEKRSFNLKFFFLATFFLSLLIATPSFAGIISASFNEGFIGDQNGNNKAQNAFAISTSGITRLSFVQNSSTTQFELQGNDLAGFVTFYDNNNVKQTIPGFINWRNTAGSIVQTMVFYPNTGTSITVSTSSGNYTITDTKNIGLTFNGKPLDLSGGVVTGNAANNKSAYVTELNTYYNSQPKLNITATLSVTEATGVVNAVATVTLNPAATVATTVSYTTSGGTATIITDYTNTTGPLTFAIGEFSKTITVPVLDDFIAEGTETFNIVLADAVNAAIVTNTTVVSILDNEPAPSNLTYSTPNVYAVGTAITSLNPSVTGNVASYALTSGTLPNGLSFSTTDGKITGTPTTVTALRSFTVTATNAVGSTVSNTFSITVNEAAPTNLTYNSPNVYTVGTAITSLNPSVTGNVVSYALTSGTLPNGLSFSTTDGKITGTPTTVTALRNFTVTATNTGGSTVSNTFTITVNEAAPTNLTYNTPNVYTAGTAITSLNPSVTGNVVSYALTSGTLPNGLTFSTTDGKIIGTPSTVTALRSFTVTATNTGGSTVSNTFTITVNDVAPTNLSYNTTNVYPVGTAITSLNPSVTGNVVSYALTSGTLPSGLSFSTTDGKITGTPSTVTALRSFTVTATNTGGSTVSNTFTITINDVAPTNLTYNTPNVYTVGTAITSLNPSVTGNVVSYALTSGTLPNGLSFSTTDGKITGTPTTVTALRSFTVTATNTGGNTVSNTFDITVNDVAPTNLSYPTPKVYVAGTAIPSLDPTVTGNVVSYALTTGSLPLGLSFNTTNGKITGNPNHVTSLRSYTVTATNSGGSTVSNTFTITVNATAAPAPTNLTYFTPNVYTVGTAITSLNPSVTGTIDSYALTSGTLPNGLSFSTSDGKITGTPTAANASRSFTVTATNSGGDAVSNTFTITVNDVAPTGLTYNTPNVYTVGTAITSLNPSVTGNVVSYALTSGTLPSGLSFSTTDGKITGTPTTVTSLSNFTVTATNSGGNTVSNTFTITVNPAAPSSLSYNTPNVYNVGSTITSLSPTVTGTVTSYSISTPLPTGLLFNTTTGVISGTPTVTSPATDYTVTATNGTGSTNAVVRITVNNAAPTGLSYTTPNVYSVGSTITSLSPTVTGTVTSYSISTPLPTGLLFNTTTGVISGNPSVTSPATDYTVTATNGTGSTTAVVRITVNNAAPTGLSYTSPNVYTVGSSITSLSPTVTGTVTSYSISTPLPTGLSFNTTTGVISGNPSVTSPATDYTVTATNGTGSTTAVLRITVISGLPTDTDGDGVSDAQEAIDGTNPNDGCSYNPASQIFANTTLTWKNTDCDGDGTNNGTDPQPLNYCVGGAGGNPPSIGSPSFAIFGSNDCDNDGIPNSVECASGGPSCQDYDGDGIPNFQDPDSDNDGILDSIEKNIDSDGDGIPNYLDLDSDNDGILDRTEGSSDRDGDGTPNYLDLDSDGDSILDAWEATDSSRGVIDPNYNGRVDQNGAFIDNNKNGLADFLEANPAPIPDTDKDGTADFLDLDSDGDSLLDSKELTADPDGDGRPNYRDLDSDGDWLGDSDERDSDNDGDGIPNYLDLDSDGDTIPDAWEGKNKCATCTTLNDGNGDGWDDRGQYVAVIDTDKDGTADFLDLDSDNDCIPDRVELGGDIDGDDKPNFRDSDSDNDGILDALEAVSCNSPVDTDKDGAKDFEDLDSDNDGIPDKIEAGSDPSNPVDTDKDGTPDFRDLDSDNDGIPDKLEAGNDPNNPLDTDKDGIYDFRDLDSDNDGIPDKIEAGVDPNNPVDTDKDGTPDFRDLDSDNDGIPDKIEAGVDPNNPVDTDKDGTPDFRDLDSDNDGIPDKIEAGSNPSNPVDTDNDGTPDFRDLDSDNDGISDKIEAGADPNNPIDTDKDGTPDFRDTDSDNDGIPDLFEAGKDPNNPVDTDKDGTPDYRDIDSDNDGIPDSIEAGNDPINPVDTDKDGTPDFRDLDSDNDGIPDKIEAGKNPSMPTDTDKDGIPDFRELDSDNDSILDKTEAGNNPNNPLDTDSDGTPDFQDLDTDSDGIPDKVEAGPNPNAPVDSDTDGTPDFRDLDADNDGVLDKVEAGTNPATPTDTDKDSKPDFQDMDDDNDGILDVMEDNLDYGGLPDCDNDGIPNRLDPDVCPSFVPQGLSPNGDGKNDKLIIPGILGFKNSLTIFNRWGEIVYETKDYKNDWGGESNNVFILKDGLLPDGVYYYIVDFYGVKPNISTFIFINRLKNK